VRWADDAAATDENENSGSSIGRTGDRSVMWKGEEVATGPYESATP